MADKIVVLNAGKVEQIGSPLELYDRPANRFVAGFIEVTLGGGNAQLADGAEVGVPSGATGKAVLGVRPEHVYVADTGPKAKVVNVEPSGAETYVTFTLEGSGEEVVAAERTRREVHPGETLSLGFDNDHLHLFDTETGARI